MQNFESRVQFRQAFLTNSGAQRTCPTGCCARWGMPTIDHRCPEFAQLAHNGLENRKAVFRAKNTVVIYPSLGIGAWEAAIANTLSPGDKVLMAPLRDALKNLAEKFKLEVDFLPVVGAGARSLPRSRLIYLRIVSSASRRSWWSTTKRRPA
jgi:hypothetical protein